MIGKSEIDWLNLDFDKIVLYHTDDCDKKQLEDYKEELYEYSDMFDIEIINRDQSSDIHASSVESNMTERQEFGVCIFQDEIQKVMNSEPLTMIPTINKIYELKKERMGLKEEVELSG